MPLPNGQMPAMARNRVDLPAPDGPVTRVRSSPRRLKPSRRHQRRAVRAAAPAASSRSIVARRRLDVHDDRGRIGRQRRGARDRRLEAVETRDHRPPFRHRAIGRDEERQRVLHAAEGRCGLHHAAELDLVGEIGRRHQHVGKDHRGLRIARGERRQPLGAAHDAEPVLDHAAEARQQPRRARRVRRATARSVRNFPATRTRLKRKSASYRCCWKFEADQRPADQMRQAGAEHRIDQRAPDQIAGNRDSRCRTGAAARRSTGPTG